MLTDILNRPIKVGDTILTTGFYSPVLDTLTTVKKVNKTTIIVELQAYYYDYNKQDYVNALKRMKRQPYQCVVVDAQINDNRTNYPEYNI